MSPQTFRPDRGMYDIILKAYKLVFWNIPTNNSPIRKLAWKGILREVMVIKLLKCPMFIILLNCLMVILLLKCQHLNNDLTHFVPFCTKREYKFGISSQNWFRNTWKNRWYRPIHLSSKLHCNWGEQNDGLCYIVLYNCRDTYRFSGQ